MVKCTESKIGFLATSMDLCKPSFSSIRGIRLFFPLILLLIWPVVAISQQSGETIELGQRPITLAEQLPDGELKERLLSCADQQLSASTFSIAHRGAPFRFPEHTLEGYTAAAKMGAGIIECDVTFTKDRELVCRHSQCDLHTTTNILGTPLAEKCSSPPDSDSSTPFKDVKCCTSDITLAEFRTLKGKMDAGNKKAKTVEEFLSTVPRHKTELYSGPATLMTHSESIQLFKSLGVKMVPELKKPQVKMPFDGDYTQQKYAQALVDEYNEAKVSPADVYLQSFQLDDIKYWINNTAEFAKQAVWLDGRYQDRSFKVNKPKSWKPSMQELSQLGLRTLAPPLWMLLDIDQSGAIAPSDYAVAATDAGLDLITWTLERSGPLNSGGGWYYQTVEPEISNDGDMIRVMDVLASKVGVKGIFSDWPATTSFYANCMGL